MHPFIHPSIQYNHPFFPDLIAVLLLITLIAYQVDMREEKGKK
jgi:hypothetical protein